MDNKKIFPLFPVAAALLFLWSAGIQLPSVAALRDLTASVFFVDSSTPEMLQEKFTLAKTGQARVKVLIVPGHDDVASGASFGGLREADLTLALANELAALMKSDARFSVKLARNGDGYDAELADYFSSNRADINAFRISQQAQMRAHLQAGKVESNVIVEHNFAPSEVAFRLYGINKWANDNAYDLVLHVHFNDVPRKNRAQPGAYEGFSIYIPERQYSNAKGSAAVAQAIRERFEVTYTVSTLPQESAGVIEDQELIAIGSNNSLDAAAVLIEYAYIYEPIIQNAASRQLALSDMALQTYLGFKDFFEQAGPADQSRYVPHAWQTDLERGARGDDVLALQAALMRDGSYPPAGQSRSDCPLSGLYGACTQRAVREFQQERGISPQTGSVGEKTREVLNALYGS